MAYSMVSPVPDWHEVAQASKQYTFGRDAVVTLRSDSIKGKGDEITVLIPAGAVSSNIFGGRDYFIPNVIILKPDGTRGHAVQLTCSASGRIVLRSYRRGLVA